MTHKRALHLHHSLLTGYKRPEVSHTHIHPRLKQQGRGLPAVMSLVVEEVLQKKAEVLGLALTQGVGVADQAG